MSELDDRFSGLAVRRASVNDVVDFTRDPIAFGLCDLACEDDVFEVLDREVVIFDLIGCMGRDDVAERPDQMAKVADQHLGYTQGYVQGELWTKPVVTSCATRSFCARPAV